MVVPNAFVITAAAFDSFLQSPLHNSTITLRCHRSKTKESARCQTGFECLEQLRAETVAVRSSGSNEDSAEKLCWPIQHISEHQGGSSKCHHSNKQCWASAFQENVLLYQRQSGEVQLEILKFVQEMVRACASGVMFTASTVNSSRQHIVIEATFGLGEALVDGKVAPDRYIIKKRFTGDHFELDIESVVIGEKKLVVLQEKRKGWWKWGPNSKEAKHKYFQTNNP